MSPPRIGMGFDAHPFADGRPLRLGGVSLPYPRGLQGHSDGDALLHAIADAIFGAAGLPSLGEHFSDQDRAGQDADSGELLAAAAARARESGFALVNVDAVVIAEEPRIAPHREAMRHRIASILQVSPTDVNVRGTSTNGLGFLGRGEGVAAIAIVLLLPTEN